MLLNKGCVTTLRNKENQLAYDLAVRNPEVGRLLMTHTGMYMYTIYSMMVTSSLWCGEFYILNIDVPCAHYAGDVTIIQYIVYSMLTDPIYKI